jgi:DNA-binding ferritin-like protein
MSKELPLEYLQTISQSDFYKNDKEFLKIIKKLTAQSASLNNKAIALVALLNEAERIKLEMVQKEIELGLSGDEKPYGKRDVQRVANRSLLYKHVHLHLKKHIEDFIKILESYLECDDLLEKKEMLERAKILMEFLEKEGIDVSHFIITPNRSKVWHILEHSYGKTIRKVSIDFFIQKIKTTRLQHIEAVDEIIDYHKEKKENIIKLSKMLKGEIDDAKQKEIDKLKAVINKELDADVAPLLIDTHKIMESLDFMIEEIPQELEESQRKELQNFLPVLSEYYTDQVYALSGGNAFTNLAKNLKYIQELIDNNEAAGKILSEVHKLEFTMQHLYILHWIAESLLKEILSCYEHSCSLGRTVNIYNKKYKDTKTLLATIKQAIHFRNSVAHQGVIWKPAEIKDAIENYKEYVDTVAKERSYDMDEFYLSTLDRELTTEQKKVRVSSCIKERLGVKDEALVNEKIFDELLQELEKSAWQLNHKRVGYYKSKIYHHIHETFCQKYLEMSYKEASNYIHIYSEKNPKEKKATNNSLTWTSFHQLDPLEKEEVNGNIEIFKKAIEQVSDKRYNKGGFFSWMKS